jgi:PhoPQ-activated pathogenicity-related protein
MRAWLLASVLAVHSSVTVAGVLEDYVRKPDPAYSWALKHEESGALAQAWFIEMQSQRWLDETRVDRPVWTHELRIARPRGCTPSDSPGTAVLLVSGGSNKAEYKHILKSDASLVVQLFCRTVIEIKQIPNQPLVFLGDDVPRKEDAIIAYSFDRFLNGDTADWPVQNAMVKAVVRAMDTAQQLSRQREDIPDIDGFVLIGASKRGWTSYLTSAVDPRVKAVIPVSIDIPNLPEHLPRVFAAYGEYPRALKDYKAIDLGCRLDNKRGDALLSIVDPFRYREQLKLPKFLLNAAGDEFFLSDSSNFYYDGLQGSKRLRYTPNADHGQSNFDRATLMMQARNWIDDVLGGRTPPALDWKTDASNVLTVRPTTKPREVLLWTAENPVSRDFRVETQGTALWKKTELEPQDDGSYRVQLTKPEKGWRAAFVEAHFGGLLEPQRQVYTTGIHVLPDTMPFAGNFCADKKVATSKLTAPKP